MVSITLKETLIKENIFKTDIAKSKNNRNIENIERNKNIFKLQKNRSEFGKMESRYTTDYKHLKGREVAVIYASSHGR